MALDEDIAGGQDQGFYDWSSELGRAVNRGTFVRHGSDSTVPRPTPGDSTPLGVVVWVGSAAPDNHLAEAFRDVWLDAANNVWKAWDGSAWVTLGGGSSSHPDLAAHDTLGLATQTELDGHTGTAAGHHAKTTSADLEPGGPDPLTVDAAAGTGSLRTLGTAAQQAAAGDHGHAAGGAVEVVQEYVLGTAGAIISFGSIPQTYRSLLLVLEGSITTNLKTVVVQLNGDTGLNYDYTEHRVTSTGNHLTGPQTGVSSVRGWVMDDNAAGGGSLLVPNYANSARHKILQATGAAADAATGGLYTDDSKGRWRNTAAVTQLDLLLSGTGDFVAGTTATLYGLATA